MAFVPGSIVSRYSQPVSTSSGGGFVPGSIVSKYTSTPPDATVPTTSFTKDWLGIKNPDTYFQDALNQAGDFIMHPIKGVENVVGAVGGAFSSAFGGAYQANKTALGDLTNDTSWAHKTADILHSVGADAAVVFSPISAAFSAAAEVPVLKEAADVLAMPFAVTGKIGDFAAETFIKALPLSQESKDLLAPAFGEIGSLAGQILLGGRIVNLIARGVGVDKVQIDTAIKDATSKAEIAKQEALKRQQMQPEAPVSTESARTAPITSKVGEVSTQQITGDNRTLQGLSDRAKTMSSSEFTNSLSKPEGDLLSTTGQTPSEFHSSASPLATEAQKYSSAEEFVKAQVDKAKIEVKKSGGDYSGQPESFITSQIAKQNNLPLDIVPGATKVGTKALTDFYNKVKGTPAETSGTTQSGLAKSIEAKAVEQGVIDHAKEVATYEGSTLEAQSKVFSDVASKGIDEIRATVRGEKSLPEGGKPFSFIVNAEDYLKKNPSADLAHELINSPLVSQTSEAASTLGLGQNRVQDSFTAKAREIQKAREVKSKVTPEKRATLKKQAKEAVNKVNLTEADLGKINKFIQDNLC